MAANYPLEKQPLQESQDSAPIPQPISRQRARCAKYWALLLLVLGSWSMLSLLPDDAPEASSPTAELEACAWSHLEQHVPLLDVPPIARSEFLQRQATLAAALDAAGVDAFIAEPSASTTYYANVSSSFELSERPFLVVIDRRGQFTTLVPKFEVGRIAKLEMVYDTRTTVTWGEEESPYDPLVRTAGLSKVMVDE
ncbi:unnamed protein product, partial [Clonostachys rosea]